MNSKSHSEAVQVERERRQASELRALRESIVGQMLEKHAPPGSVMHLDELHAGLTNALDEALEAFEIEIELRHRDLEVARAGEGELAPGAPFDRALDAWEIYLCEFGYWWRLMYGLMPAPARAEIRAFFDGPAAPRVAAINLNPNRGRT